MRTALPLRPSVFLLLLCAPLLAAEKPDPDLFQSVTARLELSKPRGWHFASIESALANRATVKAKDAEFQKALEERANAPLVIAAKHEEPYDKMNPSFQVIVRPAGSLAGMTGSEILKLVEPTLRAQFADFTPVEKIRDTKVDGHRAARMTARYTVRTQDGREFPTQATIVMIPKDQVLYQIAFSGPPEGPDALTGEVDEVLASVRFVK